MGARRTTVCALVAVTALAGCGGGDDDKKSAQDVVRDFVTAVNEKDGDAFCTEIATREYVEKVTQAKGKGAIDQCKNQIDKIQQPKLEVVKLTKTQIEGDRAAVTAELNQQGRIRKQIFNLVKEDGGYRLTSAAGG